MNLLQIDASDRNDTNQMQRLRDRFSTGRSRLESPATFDTPEIEKDNEDAQKQKQTVSSQSSFYDFCQGFSIPNLKRFKQNSVINLIL